MAENFGLKIGLEGEKEFKKALSDINSSFKVLGSEMKLVTSQFDKNDSSVKALAARNTVLNKEIETQKQKIEVLRQALQNSAESFGENDRRTQNWQVQLNNAEAALNDMEREVESNEKAIDAMGDEMDDTGGDADKLGDSVEDTGEEAEDAGKKFEKFKSVISTVGKATAAAVTAIATAAAATGKALWNMANQTAEYGDEIEKNSQKVGLTFESYQKWDYAMKICGTEMSSCTNGLKTLTNKFDDAMNGSSSATEQFNRLGLSMEDLQGLSREDVFATVVKSLQNVTNETDRAALANDMFGKSGQELLPLFNLTEEELQGLMDECEAYGMVMSDDAVKASAAFEDSLSKLQATFGGLKNRVVGEMLPALSMIMDGLSDLIAGNETAAETIKAGAEELIGTISSLIPQFVTLILTIAQAVLESAPGIIRALAQGILDAIPLLLPTVLQVVTDLVTTLLELLPQIVQAGMQIIASLVSGIAQGMPELIPQMIEVIIQIVQTLLDNLPLILDTALQLITGLAEGLLNAIPVLVAALPQIITSIVEFLMESIPKIVDAGIKLLTSLIQSLPKIIQTILTAVPQIITGLVNAFTKNIPAIIQSGVDLLISLIRNLPTIISTIVRAVPQIVSGLVSAFVNNAPQIVSAGVTLLVSLIKNLPSIIASIVKAVPQIISALVSGFTSSISSIANAGGQLITGLWNGISDKIGWIKSKIQGFGSSVLSSIKSIFGIHSPSKETAWIGQMLVQGLSDALRDHAGEAVSAAERLTDGISDSFSRLNHDLSVDVPTEYDLRSPDLTEAAGVRSASGFTIALNIANFNNYSASDIRALTQEVMVTANNFMQRRSVAFG